MVCRPCEAMTTLPKIAVSRWDVLLTPVLIAGGLTIWFLVELAVSLAAEKCEPHEDRFRAGHQVQALEARVATAQDELATVRARVIEHRLEHRLALATFDSLQARYPRLDVKAILAIRPETLRAFAQARLERDAAERLVAALESEAVAGAGEVLAKARLERVQLATRVAAFEAAYPALGNMPAASPALLELPAEQQQALAAEAGHLLAGLPLGKQLDGELEARTVALAVASARLAAAMREAADDLKKARRAWTLAQRVATMLIALVGLGVFLLSAAYLIRRALPGRGVRGDGRLALALAGATLLILYGYQSARPMGAFIGGLVALLGIAWLAGTVSGGADARG